MASSDVVANFPHDLRQAQEAIELPEVQDMIRRLSEYNLGVFMPIYMTRRQAPSRLCLLASRRSKMDCKYLSAAKVNW